MRLLVLALTLLVSPVLAATNAIHEYQLTNGLRLYVKEDHRSPVVVSTVWYKVGGAYETPGITGISHALEHIMFKGTAKHPAGEFSRIIAENGGQENAATDADYTVYYQELAANKLPLAFELEADRMQNLVFQEMEFAKEINVVKEERFLRYDDNPQALTYERFLAQAFLNNPYHHSTIGWMSDLNQMQVSDLQRWYKQWYGPNNAIIVVVGDVKPEEVYQLALQYFGKIKPIPLPERKHLDDPNPMGKRELVVQAPAKLPWVIMGYNVPVYNTAKEPWEPYALTLLAAIMDTDNSSRLVTNLVRGKQVAADVSVNYTPFSLHATVFSIDATPAAGHNITELKQAISEEIKSLQDTPVTVAELARVKIQAKAQFIYDKDSIVQQAMWLGSLLSVGIPWQEAEDYIAKLDRITPQQIQMVAKKYLINQRLSVAELQPLPISDEDAAKQKASTSGVNHVR